VSEVDPAVGHLLTANPLREPLLREVIAALALPPGSDGLDAGCGVGQQALLLAEAVGPRGRVTGVDTSTAALAVARDLARAAGVGDRVTFEAGDVGRLDLGARRFDWVWSADCIGYPAGDLASALRGVVPLLRPGGRVVLLGWTSQQLLPGHASLEARLNATRSAYAPLLDAQPPEAHFLRAPQGLRAAGLVSVRARTFARSVQAPLGAAERLALLDLFAMLWGEAPPGASPEDARAFQRLCAAGSPACVLDLPGYYGFFTYTVFEGTAP
jgi:SAM-dependent methyltransferase